jgi:hypothetical protein
MQSVDQVLDGVLAKIGRGGGGSILRVMEIWPDVAGPGWVDQAKPVRLDRGVLVVEVADGLAASRLRFDVPGLQSRIDGALGGGVVVTVVLKTGLRRERPEESP